MWVVTSLRMVCHAVKAATGRRASAREKFWRWGPEKGAALRIAPICAVLDLPDIYKRVHWCPGPAQSQRLAER